MLKTHGVIISTAWFLLQDFYMVSDGQSDKGRGFSPSKSCFYGTSKVQGHHFSAGKFIESDCKLKSAMKETISVDEINNVLLDAVRDKNLELVGFLLSHGADSNFIDQGNLKTPVLCLAVMDQSPSIVRALLEKGANPDSTDALGRSAMTYAAALGPAEMVSMLRERNASLHLEDRQGFSPKSVAIYRGNRSLIKYL